MHRLIPFGPLINLVMLLIANGGVHIKKISVLSPWLVKTILLEPFRLMEEIYLIIKNRNSIKEQPPVFILGFYRSGTTWLQELMRCNPRFQTPTIFQTIFPEIMLVFEPVLKPVLQYIVRTFNIKNSFHRLDFDWDFPGEEDVAINALSTRDDFNLLYQYPSAAQRIAEAHFLDPDKKTLKAWVKAHRYFVQKLTLKHPGKRLVLKSPPNTGRLALLKSNYPDAKFIFIKRDQQTCLLSNKRLWKINRAFSFECYSEKEAEVVVARMYDIFHANYEEHKRMLRDDELAEVAYDDLVKDPVGVVEKIYKTLRLENNDRNRDRIGKLVMERKDYKRLDYEPPAEVGVGGPVGPQKATVLEQTSTTLS